MLGVKNNGNIKYCISRIDNYKNSDTWSTWHTNKNILEKISGVIILI